MKKKITLFLVFLITLTLLFALVSCDDTPSEIPSDETGADDKKPPVTDKNESGIVIPDYKEYDRNTVDFSTIEYIRPDIEDTINRFDAVTEIIAKDEIDVKEQLKMLTDLEVYYHKVTTAKSFASIRLSKSSYDPYWTGECDYILSNFPYFSAAVERLYRAAAVSRNKEYFESEYFGDGALDELLTDITYTEELTTLLSREVELKVRYHSLSPNTVNILYKGISDSTMAILSFYDGAPDVPKILEIYNMEYYKQALEIYVDLLMCRKLIATELDMNSYSKLVCISKYGAASPEQINNFIDYVEKHVLPLYSMLEISVFDDYFRTTTQKKHTKEQLINTLYEVYGDLDPEISDIYSYMLQFKLYDVELSSRKRESGLSFTEYMHQYDAPFLFTTLDGNVCDLTDISFEFGSFIDAFFNNGIDEYIEFSEISSRYFSLITLEALRDRLSAEEFKQLAYYTMRSTLNDIITSCCIARFERDVYALDYYDISELKLIEIADDAISDFRLNIKPEYIISSKLVDSPMYYQASTASAIASLELFFEPKSTENNIDIFKSLVKREDKDESISDVLNKFSLSSPLKEDTVKKYSDMIYYFVVGAHYYKEFNGSSVS